MTIPIDRQVAQRIAASGGNEAGLMQEFQANGDLVALFALQEMKRDKQAYVRDQQAKYKKEATVKDKLTQEVYELYREDVGQRLNMGKNPDEGRNLIDTIERTKGVLGQQQNIANAKAQQAGITQPTRMGSAGGLMKLASGGIVGFASQGMVYPGGITQAEIDAYRQKFRTNRRMQRLSDQDIVQRILKAKQDEQEQIAHLQKQSASGSGRSKLSARKHLQARGLIPMTEDLQLDSFPEPTPNELASVVPPTTKKDFDEETYPSGLQGPSTLPPTAPKVEAPSTLDPSSPPAPAGLPTLDAEDFTLGKDTGRNVMLEGGVGEAARKGLEIDPETRAGERRTQTADSMGRAEGMETFGRQVRDRQALTDKLYTPEQEARNRKRALVMGAAGRGSTVGAGVAAAMMNIENKIRDQKMKNLDDLQGLEQKGILFKQQTGEKMEASYDKALDTYYGAREASMDALQNATAQDLANARTNAQIESNIAIQNNTTLNKDLDRKATAAWRQLDRDAQALKDKNITLEKGLNNAQTSLREMNAELQTAYTNAELADAELGAIQTEIGNDTPTPEQRQRLNLRKQAIRNEVNTRLNMRPSPDTPSFLETMDKLAKRVEEYGGRLEGSLDTIDVDLGKYG